MYFQDKEIYHIYNRGNNKQRIFFNNNNYLHFLQKIRNEWKPFCEILCWCLMPNHFHFLILATEESCKPIPSYGGKPMQILARKIGLTLSSYAQHINFQNKTTGSLFQQKTKAKSISEYMESSQTAAGGPTLGYNDYFINCFHYIHQNPLKSKLVTKIEEWEFSSFRDYAGFRSGDLCNIQLFFELSGYAKEKFYDDSYKILDIQPSE
jgi:putative transposase